MSKLATGRLTIALSMWREGGLQPPPVGWLTDVKKKKRKSHMTPLQLPPSREEPDGTKAPHCCPLTQDHQGPGSKRGTGGWIKDGAGVGGGEYGVCVVVGRGSDRQLKHNRVIGLGPI